MYNKDKVFLALCFITVFLISYIADISYVEFAQIALTVNSISFAVYIAAASALLGSKFAKELKQTVDNIKTDMTQMGILSKYLSTAGIISLGSIVISSMYCLPIDITVFSNPHLITFFRLFDSISYSIFALSLSFLYLIFKLLVSSMVKSV